MADPRAELGDPSTPPDRLAALAQEHPELGAEIAAHPNAYPELQAWIAQYAQAAQAAQAAGAAQPADAGATAQPAQGIDPQSGAPAQGAAYPGYAAGAEQPTQQFPTQQFPPQAGQAQPQAWGPPGAMPQGDGFIPGAGFSETGAPAPKKRKTALIVSLVVVLVVLLAGGGVFWWLFGSKLGGAATPEAAAKKLVTSVTSLDPLSLYGALAPSEFAAFEPASTQLLDTQTDAETQSAEEFLAEIKREVSIKTTTPLETATDELVEGEVERVTVTEGVIEIDGDPKLVADLFIDFYGPIFEAQAESYGYGMSSGDLNDMRDEFEDELAAELPYTLDFSDVPFEMSVVTVKEGGAWYVSPVLTFADYVHRSSGNSDRVLGDSIIEPAKQGAKSAADAATELTQAIMDGDYEAIVEQMPIAERRFLSIYGNTFGFEETLGYMSEEANVRLDEASYTPKDDSDPSRITVERLAFTTSRYDWVSSSDRDETLEITDGKSGLCVKIEGTRSVYTDYYGPEYDHLFDRWIDDLSTSDSYITWLEKHGYAKNETEEFSDSWCLAQEVPVLDKLGIDEWAIVAVEEDGAWKITPLGTLADIAAIITNKVNEAAKDGKLDSLFT